MHSSMDNAPIIISKVYGSISIFVMIEFKKKTFKIKIQYNKFNLILNNKDQIGNLIMDKHLWGKTIYKSFILFPSYNNHYISQCYCSNLIVTQSADFYLFLFWIKNFQPLINIEYIYIWQFRPYPINCTCKISISNTFFVVQSPVMYLFIKCSEKIHRS